MFTMYIPLNNVLQEMKNNDVVDKIVLCLSWFIVSCHDSEIPLLLNALKLDTVRQSGFKMATTNSLNNKTYGLPRRFGVYTTLHIPVPLISHSTSFTPHFTLHIPVSSFHTPHSCIPHFTLRIPVSLILHSTFLYPHLSATTHHISVLLICGYYILTCIKYFCSITHWPLFCALSCVPT